MDALIRLGRYWQGSQWSRLCLTFAGLLTTRAALDGLGHIPLEGRPPPGGGNSFMSSFHGAVSGQTVAVGFLQNVRAQASRCIEEIQDLFPGIRANPEPPMDIGGEAGLFLLHIQSDMAVEVLRPLSRSREFDESLDLRVLVLEVGHAGGVSSMA